jgi:hypothetical protein
VAALIGGALALAAFVVVEARREHPMVPLELFRSRAFAAANLSTFLLYAALAATFFFLPFVLIQARHFPARAAGAALLPFVVIVFVLSRWAGGLVDRYGPRLPLTIGPAIAAAGLVLLGMLGARGSYLRAFLPGVSVLGLGMAITIAPLTTTVINAVEPRHTGLASGINNAVSRSAGLVAIAALGILFYRGFSSRLADALDRLAPPPEIRRAVASRALDLGALTLPPDTAPAWKAAVEAAVARALLGSFRVVMLAAAALAAASALVGIAMLPSRRRQGAVGQ